MWLRRVGAIKSQNRGHARGEVLKTTHVEAA